MTHASTRSISAVLILVLALMALPLIAFASPAPYKAGFWYNSAGQQTGSALPDPDEISGMTDIRYGATRNTYNSVGQLVAVEVGELSAWPSASTAPANWTGFTVFQNTTYQYDARGNIARESIAEGSLQSGQPVTANIRSVVEYNYDTFDRQTCAVTRMNPSVFGNAQIGSGTSPACTLGPEGNFGPDRVTKTAYVSDHPNQRDLVASVEMAVGTPLQQFYVTNAYTGRKLDSVTDANGNKTAYQYDGLYRLERTTFPSKTTPGQTNSADYESLDYDASGNVEQHRRRNGQTIRFSYDALNRVTVKDIPASTDLDVYYGYNLLGAQTYVRYASTTGDGLTNSYDGFNRLESTTNSQLNTTLSYQYDKAGHRRRLTYSDNQFVSFERDGLNRLERIKMNANNTLVTTEYDKRGLVKSVWRGTNGATTTLTYDGISRLESFTHDFLSSGKDVSFDFDFSPASQVTAKTVSNSDYVHTGNFGIAGSYVPNGLNQYETVNGNSFAYDAGANLQSDAQSNYTYDAENRLISVSGPTPATLDYDPLGRLLSVNVNGTVTKFLYDGTALIAEFDANNALLRRYVHGGAADSPIVWFEGSSVSAGTERYYHSNHQGTIIGVSAASGSQLHTATYDPFGNPTASTFGRFGYTGQFELPGLELFYYKARIYDPATGRFLQTDPIGYSDQMNLYAYVGNDPVNRVDPSGMQSEWNSWIMEWLFPGGPLGDGTIYSSENIVSDYAAAKAGASSTIGDPMADNFGGMLRSNAGRRAIADISMTAAGEVKKLEITGRAFEYFTYAAAGPELLGGNLAAKSTVTLYRAVSTAEFKQIMRTGSFRTGESSLGGKWFAESADDASKWGDWFADEGGYRIVSATMEKSQADALLRNPNLDGIGPARYAEIDELSNAEIGVVE